MCIRDSAKLDPHVPAKLRDTLNIAFNKAFEVIFEKGSPVIEKTYNKEKREMDFKVNEYAASLKPDKKHIKKFGKNALKSKTCLLYTSGIDEYRFEAELLMAVTLGVSRFDILINQDMEISEEQKKIFFELVKRRVNREPSAYIMGYKEFMGLNFKVRPGILIPRPDTEILVETIIDTVKKACLLYTSRCV